jgi:hypothetical protein
MVLQGVVGSRVALWRHVYGKAWKVSNVYGEPIFPNARKWKVWLNDLQLFKYILLTT